MKRFTKLALGTLLLAGVAGAAAPASARVYVGLGVPAYVPPPVCDPYYYPYGCGPAYYGPVVGIGGWVGGGWHGGYHGGFHGGAHGGHR